MISRDWIDSTGRFGGSLGNSTALFPCDWYRYCALQCEIDMNPSEPLLHNNYKMNERSNVLNTGAATLVYSYPMPSLKYTCQEMAGTGCRPEMPGIGCCPEMAGTGGRLEIMLRHCEDRHQEPQAAGPANATGCGCPIYTTPGHREDGH